MGNALRSLVKETADPSPLHQARDYFLAAAEGYRAVGMLSEAAEMEAAAQACELEAN